MLLQVLVRAFEDIEFTEPWRLRSDDVATEETGGEEANGNLAFFGSDDGVVPGALAHLNAGAAQPMGAMVITGDLLGKSLIGGALTPRALAAAEAREAEAARSRADKQVRAQSTGMRSHVNGSYTTFTSKCVEMGSRPGGPEAPFL